jgi:prevent-host-death family protein
MNKQAWNDAKSAKPQIRYNDHIKWSYHIEVSIMKITAAEFKAKCLKLMDEINKTREPVVITKRGKPIAKLVPIEEPSETQFGYMKGTVTILGDVVSSIDEPWSALTGNEDDLYRDLPPGGQPDNGDRASK